MTGDDARAARPRRGADRRPTATSNFGVGRRESHDATGFYQRFEPPELTADDDVAPPRPIDGPFRTGDSRRMADLADGSVALVVTSPPYFAGKQYEEELTRDGVPGSYREYLQLLTDVFAECKRVLEPGGRIAVNVANLGRKPYRSLSADVVSILQDELRLLLRGEVVWRKGEGAAGNCAWGSFRSPANPVLRDVTERVVIASKGRFDRAHPARRRERDGLPSVATLPADEFMAATLDVWDIAPESARRVQHPAPFPVELPERLIRLYTYERDLVLDPFMGSGSTLVAAARLGRRYVGYDLDPQYAAIARERVAHALDDGTPVDVAKPVAAYAEDVVEQAGFTITARGKRLRGTGVTIALVAEDADGVAWHFDVSGAFTVTRTGLFRTESVWRAIGRAHVLHAKQHTPVVLLTSDLPRRGSEADLALRAAGTDTVLDVIDLTDDAALQRLRAYAKGGRADRPELGFWTARELKTERDL